MSTYLLVITSCPNEGEAKTLASALIENKLAACVQMNAIQSIYKWKGEVESDSEVQLMIKTTQTAYPALESYINQHHSYDIPELIAIPIQNGSEAYLNWIQEQIDGK